MERGRAVTTAQATAATAKARPPQCHAAAFAKTPWFIGPPVRGATLAFRRRIKALGRLPRPRRSGAIRRNVHLAKMIERPSGLGAQTTPEFEEQRKRWEAASEKGKPRKGPGSGAVDRTISDVPLKTVYGPEDVAHLDLARDLAWPGEYPYTRGIHPNGYRDRLWTMRQFAGFGNAKQTNERYHFLLAQGQHGLSVAFDMPTLMGYDSDAPQVARRSRQVRRRDRLAARHGDAVRRHRHGRRSRPR